MGNGEVGPELVAGGAQGLVLNLYELGFLSKKVPPGTVLFSLSVMSDSSVTPWTF